MSDIIDKIKALRSKVPENGATEDEAIAALAAAQKLMEKHGICDADLLRTDFARDMHMEVKDQKQKQIHPCYRFCASYIEVFCGIRAWQSYDLHRKKTLKIFGYNGDVEMASYLFDIIKGAMDRGWKEFIRDNPKKSASRHTEYWSFMIGMAERINEKLKEMMEQGTSTGTDLILKKNELVQQGLENLLPDLRLKSTKSKGMRADFAAYGKGQQAGDRVNLQRPLGDRAQQQGKMIK